MPFTFNVYSSLLLLGVAQALVYAVLLGRRARREDIGTIWRHLGR